MRKNCKIDFHDRVSKEEIGLRACIILNDRYRKKRSSSNNQLILNKNDMSEDYRKKRFKGADAMLQNLKDQ